MEPCQTADMAMKEQIVARVDADLRKRVDGLLEERVGSKERLGEFLRAALIRECERREREQGRSK